MYRPGFSRWRDSPRRHPLYLPEWVERQQGGANQFASWLVNQLLALTVTSPDREEEVPSFSAVRQAVAQRERAKLVEHGGSQMELLQLFEDDNRRLATELDDQRQQFESQLRAVEGERDFAEQQVDELRSEAFNLRERIRALQARASAASASEAKTPIPASLDGFEGWCREHLSGVVTLHSRAYRGVEKSKFSEPSLIYRALLLLRDYYVPMRRQGGRDLVAAYERARQELQLEDAPVGSATRTHREQYTVMHDGKPRTLDNHLKRGTKPDDGKTFRLYYFWDDDSETVVVGWLPSHLDNWMT